MNPQFYPFKELKIIGCREVPAEPFLPRILTPIFRHIGGSVFLPPYETIEGSFICNPVTVSEEEFNDLCRQERVSRITAREPRPNNQLYLGTDGSFCYEHRSRVADAMLSYHREHRAQAEAAIRSSDFENAIVHASIARSANPVDVDLLLLKAAALKRLGRHDDAAVCRTFVGSRLNDAAYESGVSDWLRQSGMGPMQSKINGMATVPRGPSRFPELEVLAA